VWNVDNNNSNKSNNNNNNNNDNLYYKGSGMSRTCVFVRQLLHLVQRHNQQTFTCIRPTLLYGTAREAAADLER